MIIMAEKNYDFRQRMLEVHRKNIRVEKPLSKGQIEITDKWSISYPPYDEFLKRCAEDLKDYFAVSMNVNLEITESASGKTIIYKLDPTLEKDGAYRVEITERAVYLIGKDCRSAAQAGYLLEDMMSLESAPYLTLGVTDRAPLLRCRMVHSGYAEDDYPDGHLNAIAHSGINAILLYVCGVNKTDLHEFDFNELIERAARYGIDVYAYSHMQSELHPDDEGAVEYYDSLYGKLFRECPGIKGVILVGESTEFPSKDPHTSGMSWLKNKGPDGKPLINKPNPGWYTCSDYPDWLCMVKDAVHNASPDADVVFWTYNLSNCPEKDRVELIEKFPTDISLNIRFDKGQEDIRQDTVVTTADYTISFPEEGSVFKGEARAAASRGIPVYAMTNAGGLTWDIGVVPYIPAPYLWLRRFEAMRRCNDTYGLRGSMDSHHYGFYPSFISDLAKEYFSEKEPDGEKIIENLIVRDWGKENLKTVEKAYRSFSEAIYEHITSNIEQYGPLRIGPSYPLVLFADADVKLQSYPGARHHGNMICLPNYRQDARQNAPLSNDTARARLELETKAFKSCAERMISAAEEIKAIAETLDEGKRDNARRIAGVAEFVGRTYLTTYHVKLWFKAKTDLAEKRADALGLLAELKRIGALEIENVKATIPLVEFDSRLGYEPSMDYTTDRWHLEWKLELTEKILNKEIPELEKELA